MGKGKSIYNLKLDCDAAVANRVIVQWLKTYKFSFKNKFDEQAYYAYDSKYGKRGFQYSIVGKDLTIGAWIIGIGKAFYTLDSDNPNSVNSKYGGLVEDLLDKIQGLDKANSSDENLCDMSVN